MSTIGEDDTAAARSANQPVSLCAWTRTVKHEGEWISFELYLERRFGLATSHSISPEAFDTQVSAAAALTDPKRLAAVRATGLLDTPSTAGFDRITRLGAAVLKVPATFISLVEDHRDFYVSHCGFGEPLATKRQLTGQTSCHFTIQGEHPLIIPDTRIDPRYANVPTVQSMGIAAYLGVPLVLLSGEVIGAFCAVDFAPHEWSESDVRAATDLASLVVFEIELRQAAFDFQRTLKTG
jgi:GAF domain-containing protein